LFSYKKIALQFGFAESLCVSCWTQRSMSIDQFDLSGLTGLLPLTFLRWNKSCFQLRIKKNTDYLWREWHLLILSGLFKMFGKIWLLPENFRQFHQHFTCAFFVQNFGAKNYKAETREYFVIYWRQYIGEKCVRKTLMKLTPYLL